MELFGFGAAVIVGAGWMLKFLMKRMTRRDDYIERLTENHLAHNTQALIDMRNAIQELTGAIRERKL